MSAYVVKHDIPIPVATEPEIDLLFDQERIRGGVHDETMFCPVTGTLFLRPRQFAPDFTPDGTILLDPDAEHPTWETISIGPSAGNTFHISKGLHTGPLKADIGANPVLILTTFCYGQTGATHTYEWLEIEIADLNMTINSDGFSSIGNQGGYISGGYGPEGVGRAALGNRWVKLLIMPLNRRDILIYSDLGGAWVYRQLDLSISNTDNTIIAAGELRVRFPNSKGLVQAQFALFPETGTYITPAIQLDFPPQTGRGIRNNLVASGSGCDEPYVHADCPGGANAVGELVTTNGGTYTPDGATTEIALKITLEGGGNCTPLVYAGHSFIEGKREQRQGTSQTTVNRELVLGDDSISMVIDPAEGATFTNDWVEGLRLGQSVGVYDEDDDTKEIALGLMDGVELEGAQAPAGNAQVAALWAMLEQVSFEPETRLDGMYEGDVVLKCLRLAGLTDLTPADYSDDVAKDDRCEVHKGTQILGDPRGKVTCFPVEAGQSAAAVLQSVLDVWSTWTLTQRQLTGKQKLFFGPESTETTPIKTFWRSHLKEGWDHSYWSNLRLKKSRRCQGSIPWNAVAVRGKDPNGSNIQARYDDEAAQDPTKAETDRPWNWFGSPIVKRYNDARLVTQEAVDRVRDVLKWRFVDSVQYATWTAEYDKRLFIGSVVTLEARGDYRIASMKPTASFMEVRDHEYRPTEYVGEKVEPPENPESPES